MRSSISIPQNKIQVLLCQELSSRFHSSKRNITIIVSKGSSTCPNSKSAPTARWIRALASRPNNIIFIKRFRLILKNHRNYRLDYSVSLKKSHFKLIKIQNIFFNFNFLLYHLISVTMYYSMSNTRTSAAV